MIEPQPAATPPRDPSRVVLVEDDAVIRDTLRELLEEEGFVVSCAETLDEGRAEIATRRPSVVILDFMLHAETCEPLLQELAGAVDAPAAILMSAASEAPRLARLYGVPLLRKPFDLDDALAMVFRARTEGRQPRGTDR